MLKLNHAGLKDDGLEFESVEDAVTYLQSLIAYFNGCSRNLTEEQLRRIMIMRNVLNRMEIQ